MNTVERPASKLPPRPPLSRRTLLLALPGLAAGLLTGGLSAADTKVGEPTPLRVGVSPVFPPMVFKQGKELAGVEVDLARSLAEKLGRNVVFVELDWEDQTEALAAGKIDIIMSSMSITPARNAVMRFTRPYFNLGQMALVRRQERDKHLLGLRIPPGTKVGVIKATTGDFLVQREFPKAQRKTFAKADDAARALTKGSVDLLISDSTLVWYLAGTRAADGLTAVPFLLNQESLAWGVRRGNDELVAAADKFIEDAIKDGSLLKAFRRWMAVE